MWTKGLQRLGFSALKQCKSKVHSPHKPLFLNIDYQKTSYSLPLSKERRVRCLTMLSAWKTPCYPWIYASSTRPAHAPSTSFWPSASGFERFFEHSAHRQEHGPGPGLKCAWLRSDGSFHFSFRTSVLSASLLNILDLQLCGTHWINQSGRLPDSRIIKLDRCSTFGFSSCFDPGISRRWCSRNLLDSAPTVVPHSPSEWADTYQTFFTSSGNLKGVHVREVGMGSGTRIHWADKIV